MGRQELLYKYPPDLSKAQKHRLANRIFKGVEKDPACDECECCDRKLGVEEVGSSCCYSKNEMAFLGPGIPLLFAYIRNAILLLIAFTIIFCGFCVYSNFSSDNCTINNPSCQNNIFNTISFANKLNNSDLLSIQNYILLAFVIVNILLFQFFRYNFRKIQQQCDDIVNSPSDYAIILRRLPQNITQLDIQQMVELRRQQLTEEERQKTQNLKIDHVVLSFAMGEYTRIKEANLQNFKKLIDEKKHAQFTPEPSPKLTESAKLAIVVFRRQESKQFFLYKPSIAQKLLQLLCDPCTPLSKFTVKGERVSIQRAPEPDDVVWQNSKISIQGAIIRKSIFNFLGFLVLLLGGFAQYWLAKLQQQVTGETQKQIYSIGLSIIVSVFNFIILQFLIISSQKERNQTLTEFNTVLTVKISFFQFLNTGIFVVLANFLADINNFTITETLPTDVTIVMLTNAITPNFSLWLMNYFEITGKVYRWMVKTQKMKVTQIEANQMWQGPPAEIPYKYAYILKTIWLTAFYAPLVPVVVPISIIGLTLNYFIEKHLYRYVYSVPNMLSSMVNDSAVQLMEYFPLIMSLGEFIVYIYMKQYNVIELPLNWSIPIYISIGLSLLNLLLPMDQLNKCVKLKNDDLVPPPYEKVEEKFQVTYEMTNQAYECKKKRKRDIFLINHIFGGQGKNVALNMSDFLGLNDTNKQMVKDPLLNKNEPGDGNNNNILAGLMSQNEQIPQSNKPANTTMNTLPSSVNKNIQEEDNPFAAFMKLNGNQANQVPTNNQLSSNTQPNVNFEAKNTIQNPSNIPTNKTEQPYTQGQQAKNNNINSSEVSLPMNQQKDQYKNITKGLDFKYNNSNLNSGKLINNSQGKPNNTEIKGHNQFVQQNTQASNHNQVNNQANLSQSNMGNNPQVNTLSAQQANVHKGQSYSQSQNQVQNNTLSANQFPAQGQNVNPMMGTNPVNSSQANGLTKAGTTGPLTKQSSIHPINPVNSITNNTPNPNPVTQLNNNYINPQSSSNPTTTNQVVTQPPNTIPHTSTHQNNPKFQQLSHPLTTPNLTPQPQNHSPSNLSKTTQQQQDVNKPVSFIYSFIEAQSKRLADQNKKDQTDQPERKSHKVEEVVRKSSTVMEAPKQKSAQVTQEKLKFLETFPNLAQEKQVSKSTRQRFIQDSPNELNYMSKKFNPKGAVFYQSPQTTTKSNFPHVEIYVPGLKPDIQKNQTMEQQASQKRRNFGKSKEKGQQQERKRETIGGSADKTQQEQYSKAEIYNPRFGNKKPVDIDKIYGPPDIFAAKDNAGVETSNKKNYSALFS